MVRVWLEREIPGARVEEYAPEERGRPGPGFDWSAYDVLLLDYNLGNGEDGLEWLRAFRHQKGFPPTVVLTAEGDEYVAVRAIKFGAAEYINKKDATAARLREVVKEAAGWSEEKRAEEEARIGRASRIVHDIRRESGRDDKDGLGTGYRLVRLIGQGAMSQVYLAERNTDGLSLVLKILDLERVMDSTLIQRFMQEAELVAGLSSPFVVKIYEYGLTQRYGFIAMEFFPRGDLKQRMERRLPVPVALNYMIHVAYALDAIHSVGIVHRDLKPANIMFRSDDSLALADFGISKKIQGGNDLTTIGQVLGTPHYMSPEQGEGRAVDGRSDIYSAGIMLCEMLTGEKPFTAHSAAGVIYQHVHGEIPRLPPELARFQSLVDSTLAKDPRDRVQTARELIGLLEAAEREAA